MRRILRFCAVASLLLPILGVPGAWGADCRPLALARLRASAPDGYAVSVAVHQPGFFASWIDCDDAQFGLPTAVHESTHFLSAENDAFPLVGGGAVARPHEVSGFFPPARIAERFAADDFVATYLREGRASSATDMLYLLDELNAYSHDLRAAVDLAALATGDEAIDHRDGLAAMMAFLTVYAETARADEPETWTGLRRPEVARTIRLLWDRAERVMASSCGIPRYGISDRAYIRRTCSAGRSSALAAILGRPPACPAACLSTPGPEDAQAVADEGSGAEATATLTDDAQGAGAKP